MIKALIEMHEIVQATMSKYRTDTGGRDMPWVQKGHSINEVSHMIQYVAYFEVFGYIIEPKMRPALLMD